jgi:hypothetical protein
MQLISAYSLSVSDAALPCWKDQVRRASDLAASARWRQHVASMPSLSATYPDTGGLGMAAYLRMGPFRGRQLLAQARLNALPLETLSGEGATRTCRLCHDPAPDPRSHLLLTCSSLSSVRDAHAHAVPELNRACPLPLHARISYLLTSPRAKASTPASANEIVRAQHLGLYLHDVFHISQAQLDTPPTHSTLPRM